MVAMFIIFDFVVHNPLHAETKKNLSYLDIIAAHYARLDLLAHGTIHDAKVAEFTSIARLYVETLTRDHANVASDIAKAAGPSIRRGQPDDSLQAVQRSDLLSRYEFEQLSAAGANDLVSLLLFSSLGSSPYNSCHIFLETYPAPYAPLPTV